MVTYVVVFYHLVNVLWSAVSNAALRSSSTYTEIMQGGCHLVLTGAVSVLLSSKPRLIYFTTALEGQEAFQLLIDIVFLFFLNRSLDITLTVNLR